MALTASPSASLGSFWVNDIPTTDVVVELDRDGEEVDLTGFTAATVTLRDWVPTIITPPLTAAIEDDTIVLSWPSTTPFASRGVYTLTVALTGTNAREQLAPIPFVVEQVNGWHTLASARELWADAPDDDVQLFELLDSAHTACVEFAPVIDGAKPIPSNYRQAQLLQARAVWNSTKANAQDQIGGDGMAVTVFPLDWNVKQLLRPKKGMPVLA